MAPSGPRTQSARLFRALSHPVRLQIAEILGQEESCVCHLEARLRLRQAYVSQQLSVLREAGLIAERKEGTFVYYSLADPRLRELIAATRRLAGSDADAPPALDPSDCACPRCCERSRPIGGRRGRRRRQLGTLE